MHCEEVHQLDPDGDVELTLRNPNAPFAVWDESEDAVVQHLNACDQKLPILAKYSSYYLDWYDDAKQVSIFPPELLNIDNPFDMDGFGKPLPCRFLLSSRHLMLASSIFNKKLSGPWKESLKDPVERVRRIETTEWDVDALLILFQIIHGKHSHVPRFQPWSTTMIATKLFNYMETYGYGIKNDLPTQCNRELVLWILVSWVFSKENVFNPVTRTAILDSKGPVPTLELPIPQLLIGMLSFCAQRSNMTQSKLREYSRYVRSLLSFKAFLTRYGMAQSAATMNVLRYCWDI
ncbi:Nuclear pore protein-like protein [Colletotrichum asianum]